MCSTRNTPELYVPPFRRDDGTARQVPQRPERPTPSGAIKLRFGIVGPATVFVNVRKGTKYFSIPEGYVTAPPVASGIFDKSRKLFYLKKIEKPTRRGRQGYSVRCKRSPEAKKRRALKRSRKCRNQSTFLTSCEHGTRDPQGRVIDPLPKKRIHRVERELHDCMTVGHVPLGRYQYHQKRWEKAGRAFTLNRAWGFRLIGHRKYDLPLPCAEAVNRIYSRSIRRPKDLPSYKGKKRTPRGRTRADSLALILENFKPLDLKDHPGRIWRLHAELELYRDRHPEYEVPDDIQFYLDQFLHNERKKIPSDLKVAINRILDPTMGSTHFSVLGGITSSEAPQGALSIHDGRLF